MISQHPTTPLSKPSQTQAGIVFHLMEVRHNPGWYLPLKPSRSDMSTAGTKGSKGRNNQDPLNVNHILGPGIVLGVGLSVALVALGLEIKGSFAKIKLFKLYPVFTTGYIIIPTVSLIASSILQFAAISTHMLSLYKKLSNSCRKKKM